MKRLLMKTGIIGIVLGVGFGFSATNPCVSSVNSYQLRTLGRAEAHRIGAFTNTEHPGAPSNPVAQGNPYQLRTKGRAEARQIPPFDANGSVTLADYGRIDRLRALGRSEARYIDKFTCEEISDQSPKIGQR